jgi:hypothetical protein
MPRRTGRKRSPPPGALSNFPSTAERFGNALLNHVDFMRRCPYIGSRINGCGVRQLVHSSILIHYSARKDSKSLRFFIYGIAPGEIPESEYDACMVVAESPP